MNLELYDEWKDTTNTEAVVISDRQVVQGQASGQFRSIHTTPASTATDWRGSVGWNDNHVTFESTFGLTTKYNSNSNTLDHLLAGSAGTTTATTGNDALMVATGTDGLN